MTKKETEERIRLLEYENDILRHKINEIIKHTKVPIIPKAPFARLEVHKLGCSWGLPGFEDLTKKYRPII